MYWRQKISSECSRQQAIECPVAKVTGHLFTMKTGTRTRGIRAVLCRLSKGKDAFPFPLKELALFVCTCFRSITGKSKGRTKALITMSHLQCESTFPKLNTTVSWMNTQSVYDFFLIEKKMPWSSYTKRGHQGIKEVIMFSEAINEIKWSLERFLV